MVAALGDLGDLHLHDALIALSYGLMLPAIAVLHPIHRRARDSGAILATISGTAVVCVGLAASAAAELRPAGLVILGIWWWVIGKMWTESAVLPRALGLPTAALGAVAIAGGVIPPLVAFFDPYRPQVAIWPVAEATLGLWMIALAATLIGRARAATNIGP